MSLLNNALRDLEKRERKPGGDDRDIPAGLRAQSQRRVPPALVIAGSLVALTLVAVSGWFWLAGSGGSEPLADAPEPGLRPLPQPVIRPAEPNAETASQTQPSVSRQQAPQPAFDPVPVVVPAQVSVAQVAQVSGSEAAQPAGEPAEQPAGEPAATPTEEQGDGRGDEPQTAPAATVESGQDAAAQRPTRAQRVASSEDSAAEPSTTPEQSSVRELTAAEQDRRLARQLQEMLNTGQLPGARERLRSQLAPDSDRPQSRNVMARYHLRRGNTQRARDWLPRSSVERHPSLRLLRARVAKVDQGPAEALVWLRQDPPAVGDYPEYHSMLAAMLQKTNQPEAAARVWADLLETDDSRARWWAGLGIALEALGSRANALDAFSQAARLPGLSRRLQLYVEQRLREEQG